MISLCGTHCSFVMVGFQWEVPRDRATNQLSLAGPHLSVSGQMCLSARGCLLDLATSYAVGKINSIFLGV